MQDYFFGFMKSPKIFCAGAPNLAVFRGETIGQDETVNQRVWMMMLMVL